MLWTSQTKIKSYILQILQGKNSQKQRNVRVHIPRTNFINVSFGVSKKNQLCRLCYSIVCTGFALSSFYFDFSHSARKRKKSESTFELCTCIWRILWCRLWPLCPWAPQRWPADLRRSQPQLYFIICSIEVCPTKCALARRKQPLRAVQ